MRIGIFGRGRLGSAVAALLKGEEGIEVPWVVDLGEEPSCKAEVALECSAAGAVPDRIRWAISTGTDLVVATTGWELSALEPLRTAGNPVGIMVSANFSLAVAFMRRAAVALGAFAALDAGSDLAIVERHHKMKADAPSGTAKLLAAALAEGCPRYSGWVQGRAEAGKINIGSLRAGAEVGYHELRLEAAAETIVLSHEAKSREVFARGAVAALRWIRGRKGLFSFEDMAADIIDPLFGPRARG